MDIPRIRGTLGQAYEEGEHKDKWFFTIWLTTMGGGEGQSLGQVGPWDTEDIAKMEMMKAVRIVCEAVELKMAGEVSGQYIDMKSNELKSW